MKKSVVVRNYFVLPCCLLLLNLVNAVVGYKAEQVDEPWLRTVIVIFLVLAGSSLVAFALSPAIEALVRFLHRGSQRGGGEVGGLIFLLVLGAGVFWAYYLMCNHGIASLLPQAWKNPG